eukprot:1074768_1
MISNNTLSSLLVLVLLAIGSNAFAPMINTPSTSVSSTQIGLFGLFQSPEEKEAARLRKEKEIEEQERALELMRERRTNPEKMEEYEEDVLRRRTYMKNEKREWEKFENVVPTLKRWKNMKRMY